MLSSSENYLECGYNQSGQKNQRAKEKKCYGEETDRIWKPDFKWQEGMGEGHLKCKFAQPETSLDYK